MNSETASHNGPPERDNKDQISLTEIATTVANTDTCQKTAERKSTRNKGEQAKNKTNGKITGDNDHRTDKKSGDHDHRKGKGNHDHPIDMRKDTN